MVTKLSIQSLPLQRSVRPEGVPLVQGCLRPAGLARRAGGRAGGEGVSAAAATAREANGSPRKGGAGSAVSDGQCPQGGVSEDEGLSLGPSAPQLLLQ